MKFDLKFNVLVISFLSFLSISAAQKEIAKINMGSKIEGNELKKFKFVQQSAQTIPVDLDESLEANAQAKPRKDLKKDKKKQRCQTDPQFKSSLLYRRLVYNALKSFGHPCPHLVMVTNKPQGLADAGPVNIQGNRGRGININEKELAGKPFGFKVGVSYHEAWHLFKKDYYDHLPRLINGNFKRQRNIERAADRAILKRNCYECALGYAQGWMDLAMKERNLKIDRIKNPYKDYKEDEMPAQKDAKQQKLTLKQLIKMATKLSAQQKDKEHPLDIERGLRCMFYAQKLEKQHALCKHHAKEKLLDLLNKEKMVQRPDSFCMEKNPQILTKNCNKNIKISFKNPSDKISNKDQLIIKK